MNPLYEHSGKVPIGGLLLMVLTGTGTAAIVGVAYSYLMVLIPIVYLNMLLTFGFGCGIGAAVGAGAKTGHVRNVALVSLVGFLCGTIGLYVAWGADMLARMQIPWNGDFLLAFHPQVLWNYILVFYDKGFWAIGNNAGNNNGQMVSGIPLLFFWFAEAALIIGTAVWVPRNRFAELVYCERCERWAKIEKDVRRLHVGMPDAAIALLTSGDMTVLDVLPRALPSDLSYVRLNLTCCEGCSESNHLSIDRVITQFNKKKKPKKTTKTLLNRLVIKAVDVPRVREAGGKEGVATGEVTT